MTITAIILAAGQGTRMRSNRPKVLHPVGGKPMLAHVLQGVTDIQVGKTIIVYGHGGEVVRRSFSDVALEWVYQEEQLGTAHAVQQAMPLVDDNSTILVLYGDTPLVRCETLTRLLDVSAQGVGLLTTVLDHPDGYGRIIRDDAGKVVAIVEDKDANPDQLNIAEVNTGIVAMSASNLKRWLIRIENNNAQQEYYLTDIIALAVEDGFIINTHVCTDPEEVMGINNRIQQAEAERVYQQRAVAEQMLQGVTMIRPESISIMGELKCGHDVTIEQNTVFKGKVKLGNNVEVGSSCVISNSTIGDGVTIQPFSVIDNASVGNDSRIGPFARLRPDTVLADQVHIGNFVEIKKATVAQGSKVNHLSYVGDARVGKNVNIGAGTITCNYDGSNKHLTQIDDNVFVGSNTQLVAPVTIGTGVTIAAGTTITKDVPEGMLVLSRVPQKSIPGWKRPVKK